MVSELRSRKVIDENERLYKESTDLLTENSSARVKKYWHQEGWSLRKLLGMMIATVFSAAYILTGPYIFSCIFFMLYTWFSFYSVLYSLPLIVSALFPPVQMPSIWKYGQPIHEYFQYEEIFEHSTMALLDDFKKGKSYIFACTPHGVLSYGGICAAMAMGDLPLTWGMNTATASIVLKIPILKHVVGIFGLVDASKKSLVNQISHNKGAMGSIVIYTGGIAELFKSSKRYEGLYIKKRKGFIKLALENGIDVIPVYLLGNTNSLTVLKNGFFADLSRKLQVTLTYFWGVMGTPIPRDCKVISIRGSPLGIPHVKSPTVDDIDTWHEKYVNEVERLFQTYKKYSPEYANKELILG